MVSKLFWFLALSLLVFCQDEEEELPKEKFNTISDMLHENTGYCEDLSSNKSLCAPYKDLTFVKIWDEYPPETIKSMINQKIRQNPAYNQKLEARIVDGGLVRFFAKEEINAKEILHTFNFRDALSSSEINLNLFSDDFEALKKYKKLPTLFLPDGNKNFQKFLNMMISLLLHLYNLEYSKIKEQILLLPKNLEEFEFLKYTPYEVENLMKGDEIKTKFKNIYVYLHEGHTTFKETVINSWSKELVMDLFHVEEFPYQDFVYCLLIYLFKYENQMLPNIFHGAQEKENFKPPKYSIFSYEYFNKTPIEEEDEFQMANYKRVKVIAPKAFKKDERVILDYNRYDAASYMMTGEYKEGDETLESECFDIFWLNEESSKRYNEPIYSCLNRELVFHYYAFVNYINLIGKDFSECHKILQTLPYRNISFDKEKDELIYNQCVHPEWKSDLFDFANRQLDEREDNFMHNVKKIEVYIEFRKDKNLPIRRAEILKEYFKLRLKVVAVLKKELRKFKKINKDNRNSKIKTEL